jgi:hypothetical protein
MMMRQLQLWQRWLLQQHVLQRAQVVQRQAQALMVVALTHLRPHPPLVLLLLLEAGQSLLRYSRTDSAVEVAWDGASISRSGITTSKASKAAQLRALRLCRQPSKRSMHI